jgi:competence CoiA-like predicted nuclease
MPFVAINPEGERICTLDHDDDLRSRYKPGELTCPICKAPVYFKHGPIVRAHFAHGPGGCNSDYERKPWAERYEHLLGKAKVRSLLKAKHGADAVVDLEVTFPDVHRIADVCLTINGHREVHEIQIASISIEDLEARTSDYEQSGADVRWWLGLEGDNNTTRSWCLGRLGQYDLIDYEYETISNAV